MAFFLFIALTGISEYDDAYYNQLRGQEGKSESKN